MKNTVEINGRIYDALTGKLLAKQSVGTISPSKTVNPKPTSNPQTNGVSLDGVSRRRPARLRQTSNHHNKSATATKSVSNRPKPIPRPTEPARQTQKTSTLLRSIVKKPSIPIDSSPASLTNSDQEKTAYDVLAKRTSLQRLSKAKNTMRSISVSRFNNLNRRKPILKEGLKVESAPKSRPGVPNAAPTITQIKAADKPNQVFNHPIIHANSHLLKKLPKDKLYKKAARALNVSAKTLAIGSAIIAAILFTSFLAYQKVPSVAMRVAANRAGFTGRIPSTIPAGFSFKGPLTYSKNSIVLNYKSNSDDRNFSIIQRPTEWTSESLLTNHLISSKLPYQTYHDSGLTVYVYNQGEATWVDKGGWYSITGQGILSFDQILSIASSM